MRERRSRPDRRPIPILLAAAILLGSCGTASSTSAVEGPVLRYPASDGDDGMAALITGALELEDGCLYVRGGAERYPILWPHDTRWDEDASAVITNTGDTIAIGDTVKGGGGYLDTEAVRRLAGAEAADIADGCLDNIYGEVIIVNNHDDAIGLDTTSTS